MRLLVAGSAARLGVALATALHDRGHVVLLADRFDDIEARRAKALWNRWQPHALALELHDGSLLPQLRPAVARQDAVVILGNPNEDGFDLDLSVALADAAAATARSIPLLRLSAAPRDAGAEREPVVLRGPRAHLRDFPHGIPEERTAASLPENDRALRMLAIMHDQICVVLRACECVAPGRLQFDADDLASAAILSRALDRPEPEVSQGSSFDLIDGATLASAIETALGRAFDLSGSVLHITGGSGSRLSLADLDRHFDLHGGETAGLLSHEYAFELFGGRGDARPARAHLLDDRRTRSQLQFSELTWAPRAIERFRRYLVNHAAELATSPLLHA